MNFFATARRYRLLPVAVVAFLALAGCAVAPASYMIYGERYHPGYDFGELQYYNGGKEMAVEVFNTPFLDKETSDQAIALSMRGKNRGARIAFTAQPGPLTPKQTKVIVAFNLKPSDDGYAHCAGQPPDGSVSPEKDTLLAVMIYCKRNAFVSSVRARMPSPATVDTPAFQAMIAELTRRLLPRPHPLYDDSQREEARRLRAIFGY